MPLLPSFDGTPLAWLDEGAGPAVLLLHGFASTASADFGPRGGEPSLIEQLVAVGRRVLAPDLRGHGESGKPSDPAAYGARALCRDLEALLDHLALPSVHVVGNSLGGYTAVELALRDGRVGSLVLSGVGPLTAADIEPWRRSELASRPPDDPLAAWLRGAVLPQLCVARFPTVRCPVTVLDAEGDPLDGAAFAAGFPRGAVVSIPGPHERILDQPAWRAGVLAALSL